MQLSFVPWMSNIKLGNIHFSLYIIPLVILVREGFEMNFHSTKMVKCDFNIIIVVVLLETEMDNTNHL